MDRSYSYCTSYFYDDNCFHLAHLCTLSYICTQLQSQPNIPPKGFITQKWIAWKLPQMDEHRSTWPTYRGYSNIVGDVRVGEEGVIERGWAMQVGERYSFKKLPLHIPRAAPVTLTPRRGSIVQHPSLQRVLNGRLRKRDNLLTAMGECGKGIIRRWESLVLYSFNTPSREYWMED